MMEEFTGFQLVDVRSPQEFATGFVAGAVNIPLEQLESRLTEIDMGRPLLLICQSGQRAARASERLRPYTSKARVLEGGVNAWSRNGRPLVRLSGTSWSIERQVRLAAGTLVVFGVTMAVTVSLNWLALSGFVGAGLMFAGISNTCFMGDLLLRMPWNRPRKANVKG